MYENILLESGKVFRGRNVSSIGGKVVDDSQNITIIAAGYGEASIVDVFYPSAFVPGMEFPIAVQIKNTGNFDAPLFIRITDVDTSTVINEAIITVPAGVTAPPFTFLVTLTQITDFHGLIEAGHTE